MKTLWERAERLARARAEDILDEAAAAWRRAGVRVERTGERLIVRGRALRRRWFDEPWLRLFGRDR